MNSTPLDAAASSSVFGQPSFSLANRAVRAVWSLTWLLLASWTPPPLHAWRRLLLRAFGARIAPTARVYGSARIWYPPNLVMGAYSVMGWDVICYCQDRITLEDFANVAQRAHLCAGSHDVDDPRFQLVTKPVVIGRHAWVAADAFVGPGVTLGEGAVLGARGVAFRDLEPWTIHIGNPARLLRRRKVLPAPPPSPDASELAQVPCNP
jgi:putative colanic acid biosynthesis acetyltransferase WcaF